MKKKSIIQKTVYSITILVIGFFIVSFITDIKGWVVPAADAAKQNPVPSNANSIAAGKTEYIKSCKICHGLTGTGVGTMAGTANFTTAAFKSQTDGSIFYKINTGYGKMPSYKTKIADDNTKWNLVNYLRTL